LLDRDELALRWLKYCAGAIPLNGPARLGADEYLHYYWSRVIWELDEKGWGRLFPTSPKAEHLTWSKYRAVKYAQLLKTQNADGSWGDGGFNVGPVYVTSMHLMILLLDEKSRRGIY
jgi:hypothetical protein